MSEGLQLPDPDETLDVWGDKLNDAITYVNDKVDQASAEIDQIEEILGATPTTAIPLAFMGAANGVAQLDGAAQVPMSQLGNISPSSVGAAAAQHQHGLTDLPDLQRALRTTPVWTTFNTTTSQWPLSRAALTTDALRPVIWFGGTALPADAIPAVDAWIKTDANQLVVTAPGAGTTTPPPATGLITMSQPTVVVNGSQYNITATITNGTASAKTFAYMQLAVRGPGGTPSADTGHQSGVTMAAGEVKTLTGSGDASVIGDWTVRVAYTLNESDWFDGTTRTFTIASLGGGASPGDPGSTRTIPLIGRSGLPWNSGVFRGAGELDKAEAFFTWRNRPGDSIMYFPGRTNQSDLNWMRPDLNSWPGYRIIAVPSQVPSVGNNFGTNPTYIQFWKDWGTKAKNQGWNDGRTIVRLNWEGNGDWYRWAWTNGGGPALFVETYKQVVNAIRSTAPKMLFNLNVTNNKVIGGVNWKTQIYDPLLAHYDIVGLDWYDEWPNWRTQSSFNQSLTGVPGPTLLANYCRDNNKMMWLDEWGMSWRPEAGDAAGKDDPAGIGFMWTWLNTNQDIVAGETFYEDYGTNDQFHGFLDNNNKNALAAAAYRSPSRWGR